MQIQSEYLSHQPVLVAAFTDVQGGSVLELGCGFGSTPLLHALSAVHACRLVTLESDAVWIKNFKYLANRNHRVGLVDDFLNRPEYSEPWSIVFVDQIHAETRGAAIIALKDRAEIIIAHDSCWPQLYGYDAAFAPFPERFDYRIVQPYTTALSMIPGRLESLREALA